MKREIPVLLTVLCGLAVVWSFLSPTGVSRAVNAELLDWTQVFLSVAFLLGLANLVRLSLKQVSAGHPDSVYKILMLVVLFGYLGTGLAEIHGWLPAEFIEGHDKKALRNWGHAKLFVPLQATMFSLLAFYIASAAFRAFRARSLEATLLLTAGAVVMLGQVPIGDELTGGWASRALAFLMAHVNAAGQTAIIIGATLGVLATGLRIVLGIERSYLSE